LEYSLLDDSIYNPSRFYNSGLALAYTTCNRSGGDIEWRGSIYRGRRENGLAYRNNRKNNEKSRI